MATRKALKESNDRAETRVATRQPQQEQLAPQMSGPVEIRGSKEIAQSQAAAEAMVEMQARVIMARQYPRDEAAAAENLIKACRRVSFAEDVEYSFKRGKKKNEATGEWEDNIISGPSVVIAREAARLFGHMDCGFRVIAEDMTSRTMEGFALDLQTGTKFKAQDTFEKKIQRKVDGRTEWVPADERDLRELQNKRGALLERNCILRIVRRDVIEEALLEARSTLRAYNTAQKDEATKRMTERFASFGITPDMICTYLRIRDLTQITPDHLDVLRKMYTSIRDGEARWSDYTHPVIDVETIDDPRPTQEEVPQEKDARGRHVGRTNAADLLDRMAPGDVTENRGHDDTQLSDVAQGAPERESEPVSAPTGIAGTIADVPVHVHDAECDHDVEETPQTATNGKNDARNGKDVGRVADAAGKPMDAAVLALWTRVTIAKDRNVSASQKFLAKASRLLLPDGRKWQGVAERDPDSLTSLEARTILDAIESNEIKL